MEPDFGSHPDETRLEQYSMETLGEDETAAIEEHLLVCAQCQDRLEEADAFIRTFRRVAPTVAPRAEHRTGGWLLGAVAAALVLASGLTWWMSQRQPAPAAVAVALTALRGESGRVPAGKLLEIRLDLTGLPASDSYRVQIVSSDGGQEWVGTLPASGESAVIETGEPLDAGLYFVRVESPRGEPLREFAIRAE